ncbi:SGF29 tudor-like domain-containing protein [Cokeromyces recurvatus]|uniref:SGF29 tudor-like domain-containing protein n=1 Tax=Cokeromyces recurvatus TaxID=90255 RepID=UPI002220FCC5|nr:SGF29 tudor-like domain-containing protein [Cokeromyces recurvatus]KAI7902605.1 SGF29 tudor-like domain-containing protein [Cokeromyces recurvatus]
MDRKSRTSRSATLDDTNEEVNLWKQTCNALSKLETIQNDISNIVNGINKIHTTINNEEEIQPSISTKLIEHYEGGIDLSNNEAKTIHDIIEKLSVLIALRNASEYNNVLEQKRKKRRIEQDEINSLSFKKSKTDNRILTNGTSVAAKHPTQKDKNEEWILAIVISYHIDTNKYQVEDVDQDEFGQKQRYMIQPRNVIPIPNIDEAKELTELNAGQDVLALYPGTTCFYKAKVITPPSKNKDIQYTSNYQVQFEDDNNEFKYVMPEYVLEIPKFKYNVDGSKWRM